MDDIQKKLVTMIKEQPSCINDRKQLRAILLDYLPQNKLQQNLILNAYDEDIVNRLKPSSDVTLHALQMVKILSDGYGLTKDSSLWAIISWCNMLNLNEVATVLEAMNFGAATNSNNSANNTPMQNGIKVQCGIYKCGHDFAPGDIKLKVLSITDNDQARSQGIYYAVLRKGSGSSIIENGFFKGQVVLSIKEGQRLEIGWQGEAELTNI